MEKGSLLPPVRPDCSQQLHSFIFMYWEENVTQLFDTLVSEMLDGAGHEPRPSRPVGWPGLVSGNIGRLNTRHNKHCPCRGTEQRCRVCLSRGVTRRFRSKCVECDVSYCVDRNCLAECHTNCTISRISFRPSFAKRNNWSHDEKLDIQKCFKRIFYITQ